MHTLLRSILKYVTHYCICFICDLSFKACEGENCNTQDLKRLANLRTFNGLQTLYQLSLERKKNNPSENSSERKTGMLCVCLNNFLK